jgi:hypothetical protein
VLSEKETYAAKNAMITKRDTTVAKTIFKDIRTGLPPHHRRTIQDQSSRRKR